ncbi:VF530 family protein [Pseudomonas sp. RIT-PI-AD]|uniref:VF530 family protein n=1 Tax=Pseudomonas sp. RIT-PI-AD TaxID=3035294 RepID=UPI0021D867B5|nr:VF530 family protein [Pseudomonas sp. RIT-PI-AD]
MTPPSKDPLHGMTLEAILIDLVARYGWDGLASRIDIRCFSHEPSIKSSLGFLRRTAWARQKVEALFVASQRRNG